MSGNKITKYSLGFIQMAAQILTSGCGSRDCAKDTMEASKAAYERCLEQHSSDYPKCESLKRIYEADVKAYSEASRGEGPTTTIRSGIGSENQN
jgi:hypothetical protein